MNFFDEMSGVACFTNRGCSDRDDLFRAPSLGNQTKALDAISRTLNRGWGQVTVLEGLVPQPNDFLLAGNNGKGVAGRCIDDGKLDGI